MTMQNPDVAISQHSERTPWNEDKLLGAKPPLRTKHVWAIRSKLQVEGRTRDLAMFNLAIDSKLRGTGIALAGACPGTVLAQIGAGYRDALFTLVGGLFGAIAYSYAEPTLSQTFLAQGAGKITFADLLGIPYWVGALVLATS
jgi:hypothetical protein